MNTTPFEQALRKMPAIAVGTASGHGVEFAGLGTVAREPHPEQLCWEIGSITKVFTGILLAEMSLRGEVALDDPIGRYLPGEVAARLPSPDRQPTLVDLATHTAGLPRLPRQWLWRMRKNENPYSLLNEEDVWKVLGPKTQRPARPRSRYSNFGVGLLGHLLGRAAHSSYETLVIDRVVAPLGMKSTGIGLPGVVPGFRKGEPTPPWTFGALAAAGSLRSTAADMITFAQACLDPPDGTLGEAIALARRPAWQGRIASMGLGWQIRVGSPKNPRTETVWHNGGTYGASSFLAIDHSRGAALASFGNAGPRLLSPLDGPSWRTFDGLR